MLQAQQAGSDNICGVHTPLFTVMQPTGTLHMPGIDCRSVVHRSDWPRSALICELLRAGTTANSGCVVDDHPYICDRVGAAGQGVHLHAQRRPLQTEHCRCDRAAGRAASGRWRQWARLLGQHCRHGGHCAG